MIGIKRYGKEKELLCVLAENKRKFITYLATIQAKSTLVVMVTTLPINRYALLGVLSPSIEINAIGMAKKPMIDTTSLIYTSLSLKKEMLR